jgi:hypothetical protein
VRAGSAQAVSVSVELRLKVWGGVRWGLKYEYALCEMFSGALCFFVYDAFFFCCCSVLDFAG